MSTAIAPPRAWTMSVDLAVRTWTTKINEAAAAFDQRWTRLAVRSHSVKLADAFDDALSQYANAVKQGGSADIDNAGKRLIKAYGVITAELTAARVEDDAYMVGRDPSSGTMIVIARSPAALQRAAALHPDAIAYSPDELAIFVDRNKLAQSIAAVKAAFPGAEIVKVKTP